MKKAWRAHGGARVAAGFGPDPSAPADLPAPVRDALLRADLEEAEAHLAWELSRLAPDLDEREHLALLAVLLLTQEALGRGSTHIPLDPAWLAAQARSMGFDEDVCEALPAIFERAPTIFGLPGERRPLILDGDCLYQERLFTLEERLSRILADRVARRPAMPMGSVDEALDAIAGRPSGSVVLTEEQRQAVRVALDASLAVISGGPGTGKTSIVVAILRAAVLAGVAEPISIALAAPTGKAADRMRRSIEEALSLIAEPLPSDRALTEALPRPMTLHRLLGWSPSRQGFLHRRESPLSERLVIVDESSMIDVFLMERLVSALLPDTRLVLLGDAEQLPSVAAGAVFRDLGRTPEVASVALTKSHRMDPSRPDGFNILSVAAKVNAGAVPPLVEPEPAAEEDAERLRPSRLDAIGRLDTLPPALDALSGVFLFEPKSSFDRERFLDFWHTECRPGELASRTWSVTAGRIDEPDALEPLFVEAERTRLLCVTRSAARSTGVLAINASLHRRFADARGSFSSGLLLAGEPVLVHRNDYERSLFNGDQGLVLFTSSDGEPPRPSAVFRGREGFVAHPLEAVRASIELGYATTVHKAQGGEHDVVALLLPETDSPRLLTREIVYTAITRARRVVLLVGCPELLGRAAARRVERATGVTERMRRRADMLEPAH